MDKKPHVIALYPGTFDPITNGHMSLIDRASSLFDEIIVAVAEAGHKKTLFSLEERHNMVRRAVEDRDRVRVQTFGNLLADFAREVDAQAIIRGLRAVSDFEYEFQMALMNRRLEHDIETVFLMPALSWVYLSSTIVKEVARHGGNIDGLVPETVISLIRDKYENGG